MCIYFLNSPMTCHKRLISCPQLAVADHQGEVVEGGGCRRCSTPSDTHLEPPNKQMTCSDAGVIGEHVSSA